MSTPDLTETGRLAIVREYFATGPGTETGMQEACRLATLLCHRPMAAVEWVQEDTVVIAAAAGLHVGKIDRVEALSPAFLHHRGVAVVPDASQDERFRGLRLVLSHRGVRFYAAVPLLTPEGAALGVLSVWDHVEGDLAASQAESLEALGQMVMAQLNLARRQRQLEALEAEHARMDAALRVTEAKFRGIFENTVVGIYQTTPDGRYISANPMLARIYGYANPDELQAAVGDIAEQLYVDPGARDRFIEALQKEDVITHFEAQIRRKDGSVIWIAETARVVRDAQGQVQFYEGTVQDITARRQAEEQLRTSEMLYHSLVEELPQNIFRKDARERFIFANSRFCQVVGRPLEEVLGRTDFDLFPADLARKYQEDDQRVMAGGQTLRATERNVTPDGAVHWVEVIKTPLRDASGAVVGIQGIFWDITERKRLEDALAHERDLLQALLDHSPDIIYFKDAQSRFVKVGMALGRRFNLSDPEVLVGRTVADLLQPDKAELVHAEERDLLARGEPIVNQVDQLVDHRGQRTWVSVTKVPIYNRSGQTLGLVGVARDITKLIETEQALREAEEKYRKIFENSVEGIFQTTVDGRLLQANPALARIYGDPSPEALAARLTDVRTQVYVRPERRAEFVRAVLERGSITGFESEIYRADGTTTWISESARAVCDREGRVAYFEGTVEDISVRKQAEAEQVKAQKAVVESARLKAEFVATVSHEIRTPLNAIVPNAERLMETRLDRQQRFLVESIDHGAHMLLQIVDDVLDHAKVEAGAVTLVHEDMDVHDVIERTVGFLASRAHEKSLELLANIHAGVPHHLRGDAGRLAQILNNLVGNAIKFTETGEIVVEVEAGELRQDAVELRFQVRDTGIGIPLAARDRVFQAFAQADGSMSRRYGGTGLGLAITRRFVELMGGTIDFDSEVGQGTTFRFNVWLRSAQTPHAPPSLSRRLPGLRVLVLDDNPSQRQVIAASLWAIGSTSVSTAASISEALDLCRSAAREGQPFALVFFDSELPGNDGLQTARRLRTGGAERAQLIALTPPGTVADSRGLEAAGIVGTLTKPLRQSRLAADVDSILAGESEFTRTEATDTSDHDREEARGLAVLVVEDQPFNQRIARDLLQRLGATTDTVSSGPEAIQAFENKAYDLVLMDCQMPGMDGYETTRRIREIESRLASDRGKDRRIPIVALSANALSGDRERGLEAGMDDYLTKPLRQPALLRVVRLAVARSRGDTPAVSPPSSVSAPAPEPGQPPPPGTPPPVATQDGSESPDIPVLDPEPLEALAMPGDQDVLRSFVAEFLRDAPSRIERLRQGVAEAPPERIRAEAHALKGSASYMGARRLVEACARLEASAGTASSEELRRWVATIETEFSAARRALERHVGLGATEA